MGKNKKPDFYTLNYRRNQLEMELDKIREAVSGREESFLPRITDKEGNRDLEKVEALIDAMIDNFNEYQETWGSLHGENLQPVEGEARKLFHHILYLALLGPGGESFQDSYSYCTNIIVKKSEKYSDILKNVKNLEFFKDKAEMYRAEAYYSEYYYEENPTWTDLLNYVFSWISKKAINETYTLSPEEWDPNNTWGLREASPEKKETTGVEAEEETAKEESSVSENSGSEAPAETKASDSSVFEMKEVMVKIGGIEVPMKVHVMTEEERAYEEYLDQLAMPEEEDTDPIPPMTQEEYEQMERETVERIREENEEAERFYQSWLDTLPDAEAFCTLYLEFREMMVKPELLQHIKNAAKEVEMLLDAWLFNTGESPYALGDSYGLVSARLQNATAHLKKELERARRLS